MNRMFLIFDALAGAFWGRAGAGPRRGSRAPETARPGGHGQGGLGGRAWPAGQATPGPGDLGAQGLARPWGPGLLALEGARLWGPWSDEPRGPD